MDKTRLAGNQVGGDLRLTGGDSRSTGGDYYENPNGVTAPGGDFRGATINVGARSEGIREIGPGLDPTPTRADEVAHLQALIDAARRFAEHYAPLGGIGRLGSAMRPVLARNPGCTLRWQPHRSSVEGAEPAGREVPYRHVLDAFAVEGQAPRAADSPAPIRQAALLGDPGAGKSTTLNRLACDLAERALADPAAPLPVLADLAGWTDEVAPGDPNDSAGRRRAWRADLDRFAAAAAPSLGGRLRDLARGGRLVLLLDALNQVPTHQRADKAQAVRDLIADLNAVRPHHRCSVYVSCRQADYDGALDLGLDRLTLAPLTPPRVQAVLRHWWSLPDVPDHDPDGWRVLFWQLAGDPPLEAIERKWCAAGGDAEALWALSVLGDARREVVQAPGARANRPLFWFGERDQWCRHRRDPHGLLRLAENPFLLTMLTEVWLAEDGRLPANRGELFGHFVSSLLDRRKDRGKDGADARADPACAPLMAALKNLAWAMQQQRVGAAGNAADLSVMTQLDQDGAVSYLGGGAPGQVRLRQALEATLLEAIGSADPANAKVRFRHQLLQEWFTAAALRDRIEGQQPAKALKAEDIWPPERWWQRTGWEEAAVLLAGLYPDDGWPVIRWLQDAQPQVAAQCLLESGAWPLDARGRPVLSEARRAELRAAWLPRLTDIERDPMPESRAAIGRALGLLNLDDRPGVGLIPESPYAGLPDIAWVEIPAGVFLYGEDKLRRHCDAFAIARYQVTHAQFQAFLDAEDGYANDRWWKGMTKPGRNPQPACWPIANYPRETVSWFEAMAFCTWLTDRLQPPDRRIIRLPTETEWERAARGADGRLYPWGDDYRAGYANINETWDKAGPHDLGRTSAVGLYPQAAARWDLPDPDDAADRGICDLGSNVCEWCLNEGQNPKRVQPGGHASRGLRGGSWYGNHVNARAAVRLHHPPDLRLFLIGFRLVCAAPIR